MSKPQSPVWLIYPLDNHRKVPCVPNNEERFMEFWKPAFHGNIIQLNNSVNWKQYDSHGAFPPHLVQGDMSKEVAWDA